MKLILRIALFFVLVSISAPADTIRHNLQVSVGMGPNDGFGDNVGVVLRGPGISIFAAGGTPTGWFDGDREYFPGQLVLGPTEIFWDTAGLRIGSQTYTFDEFDLNPTFLDIPYLALPSNGRNVTISIPMEWKLGGTIIDSCPSDGCGFFFASKPGKLKISFTYFPEGGVYFARSATFTPVPEPGTFVLMALGIAVVGRHRLRQSRTPWTAH